MDGPADLDFLFQKYGRAAGPTPALLKAVAYVESRFNPLAVNEEHNADKKLGRDVDSLGLMQVLYPDTATSIEPGVTREAMFDPETNVRIGAAVLGAFVRRFPAKDADGFSWAGVASYNAGSPKYKTPGILVNQEYVNQVKAAWNRYA